MEFLNKDDVMGLLRSQGIDEVAGDAELVHMQMADGESVVHLHLADEQSKVEPREDADEVTVPSGQLAELVEGIVHRLRLGQIVLVPVGKWRDVFDAVAFSLAENEDWQEFDAAATVQLNTRAPLLCEPGDFQTLIALIGALASDSENPEQGLMLVTTAAPVLMEFVPDVALRISVGQPVLADEITEVLESRSRG